MAKLTIINKKEHSIKIKIYENNSIKNISKVHLEPVVIDISENSHVTLVVKRTDNILLYLIKYILFHLNGTVNFELSDTFRYEKITLLSKTEDITLLYRSKDTTFLGVEKYQYEIAYDQRKGICIGVFLFILLTVVLIVLFIII
ncbi:hypothetical protein KG089_00645 [Carnobacteriaceae bacterium zg-ZUI252]|nr:hypothetical protein [Carnobacteriaceae bacterium zg-ZUI252]MBS4770810.1 hypothetical protein [Carnobacteriaceae bacterium zg-ZUI240]